MSKSRAGLAALALSGLAVLGLQSPASAAAGDCPTGQHYNPSAGCVANGASVNHRNFLPGGKGRVFFSGLMPGTQADLFVESTPRFLASYTVSSAGRVDAQITLPADLPAGEHHLVLHGTGENGKAYTASIPITVRGTVVATVNGSSVATASTSSPTGGLPYTGGEIALVAAAGLALVGTGSGAVVAGRRRRALA